MVPSGISSTWLCRSHCTESIVKCNRNRTAFQFTARILNEHITVRANQLLALSRIELVIAIKITALDTPIGIELDAGVAI